MNVKTQHQRSILLYWGEDFVFDEKATMFRLQPEADGKIATTPWKMREWHIANTDVGKMNLVVAWVKDYKQKQQQPKKLFKMKNPLI